MGSNPTSPITSAARNNIRWTFHEICYVLVGRYNSVSDGTREGDGGHRHARALLARRSLRCWRMLTAGFPALTLLVIVSKWTLRNRYTLSFVHFIGLSQD